MRIEAFVKLGDLEKYDPCAPAVVVAVATFLF
jgi:hypothetical protein